MGQYGGNKMYDLDLKTIIQILHMRIKSIEAELHTLNIQFPKECRIGNQDDYIKIVLDSIKEGE